MKSFTVTAVALVFFSTTEAISCDFKYNVGENSILPASESLVTPKGVKNRAAIAPKSPFECEDEFESDNETRPLGFGNRFGDDEFESAGTECASSRKTINPKNLNTIYNKLMDIVQNHTTFVQTIEIDECRTKNEPCDNGSVSPIGKQIICRQKYVKIQLKAFNDDGNIVDEQFYYPSHCICELVKLKKITRRDTSERKISLQEHEEK